jgi:hypothetical protein
MSSDHNAQPQKQDYRNEEVEVENSTGQRFPIGTYLLRVYPESFNSYDAYMEIPMSITIYKEIQKVISPRLGKTWKVIAGPTESLIGNAPGWEFWLGLIQEDVS